MDKALVYLHFLTIYMFHIINVFLNAIYFEERLSEAYMQQSPDSPMVQSVYELVTSISAIYL